MVVSYSTVLVLQIYGSNLQYYISTIVLYKYYCTMVVLLYYGSTIQLYGSTTVLW